MSFRPIDLEHWNRLEYFRHYHQTVPCTYSMTIKLDISSLRQRNLKVFPTMLYALAVVVNRHRELRTVFNAEGVLGIYDVMHPCYTVFHKTSNTFSNLWTFFDSDYSTFLQACQKDMELFGANEGILGKPNVPENCFTVSCIPWVTFDGFNLNLPKSNDYLIPIFTMGKFFQDGQRTLMPLAVQVHHAVCDGFHTARLINEVQELLEQEHFCTDY